MPLGNDVVDLQHPLCQPDAIHPRFDARAFLPAELDLLTGPDRGHLARWSLWTAKESAFKAARQLDARVRFLPREFEVRLNGARARVSHRLACFEVWFDRTEDWVHALASPAGEKPRFRVDGEVSATLQADADDAGERVRRLARSALGDLLALDADEIQILGDGGIPQAEHRGEALPIELSLSHDGRFVSCAWALTAG